MTQTRLLRLREAMRAAHLDALLVSSLPNIRYLTGFTGTNALCLIKHRSQHFLSDGRYASQSRQEVQGFARHITTAGLLEHAGKRSLLESGHRVGFESENVTYANYRIMKRVFPGVKFVPTRDLVGNIAVVKDAGEVRLIREAVKISDIVFQEVLEHIKPGVMERDIAAEISYLHKRYGADGDSFECIVASGKRGALPHARATSKRIKKGELVTLDFGCTRNGYSSDITRTVAVGAVSARAQKMYQAVLAAQQAAIDAACGGMMAKDLDAVARKRLAADGYGKYFIHSLGHGLGLQVHERPRVSALSKERLQAGSVITIEPGVYIPSYGGVRIEDDVLITPDGCEVLNKAPKELLIL